MTLFFLFCASICFSPVRALTLPPEIVIDDVLALPIALLSQFSQQLLAIVHSLGPPLSQIRFVGIQFASFAGPDDFGKAGGVEAAPNSIAMQPHQRSNRDLARSLLMELDHLFIAILAPCSPALAS